MDFTIKDFFAALMMLTVIMAAYAIINRLENAKPRKQARKAALPAPKRKRTIKKQPKVQSGAERVEKAYMETFWPNGFDGSGRRV